MTSAIYLTIRDMAILAKSQLSRSQKLSVFVLYWKMFFKRIWGTISPLHQEKIFGFTVETFSYESLWYLFREVFVHNEYFFQADKNSSPVIIDCGANIGMATLYFVWLNPQATIHAFEADPKTAQLLQKNIDRNNLTRVTVHHSAVGAADGTISFFSDPNASGSLKMSTIKGRLPYEPVEVPSKNFSLFVQSLGKPVDFLKMDIEGAEVVIIHSLFVTQTLSRIKQAVIEYHHHVGFEPSQFSGFLEDWERAGFEYQMHTQYLPLTVPARFQDILVYCYQKAR